MGEPELVRPEGTAAETRTGSRRRRTHRPSRASSRSTHGRVRALYFSLAALWGFLAGTGVVLVCLSTTGRPTGLSGSSLILVAVAAGVALAGGLVVARAYRSTTRRLS